MKLLHVADLHLDVRTHSRPDPDTGLPSALISAERCWTAAADYAIEYPGGLDAVIVAGDIFHGPNPSAAAINAFRRQLDRLSEAGIVTLVYPGNHDRAPHPGQESIVRAFNRPGSVIAVDRAGIVELLPGWRIGVLPSVSRHLLAAQTGAGRVETEEELLDGLRRIVDSWRSESDVYAITGHWPVAGSMLGGELDIAIIPEPMLVPADLDGPWRYAALGHIHRQQIVESESARLVVIAYSGAINRTSFGEESYDPVVLGVDIEGDAVTTRGLPLPAQKFRTLDLESFGYDVPVALGLADANEGAIFRIVAEDVPAESMPTLVIAARELQALLLDSGATLCRIELKARKADRGRSADLDTVEAAGGPLAALEAWLDASGQGEGYRESVLAMGRKIMEAGG